MNGRPIYLDYQATTPIDPRVRGEMEPFLDERFGNPHSEDHAFGWEASSAIKLARARVAGLIETGPQEIVFTSGATESCNLALRGVANRRGHEGRTRIVTLATEHPAVLETVLDLGEDDHEAVVLPVGSDGVLDLAQLDEVLDERTLLVSVMAANNEIGVLQPIQEIAARCHAVGALFHTDATQAAGRIPIDVTEWGVDLLSLSGHKLYGPKGVGALFVRSGVALRPLITGGSQEDGRRGGTLPPALIVGFGMACELALERQDEDSERLKLLTSRLYERICETHPSLRLFGHPEQRLPGSLSLGYPNVPADLVIRNVANQIAVSSGSACASGNGEPSRVLLALGLEPAVAETAVRISLGRFTTKEDIDSAVAALSGALHLLAHT